MASTKINPAQYLRARIAILEAQMREIDEEIRSRRADHEHITTALNEAKANYSAALTDEFALERLSIGRSFTERKQNMQQIIRGVNTGIFDEVRTYKAFLKSLNAERRRIERDVKLLNLRLRLLGEA